MTWEEARKRCISDGGDLAIADTIEKIKDFAMLDFNSNDWLFIGIHRPPGSKEWIRIDNGNFLSTKCEILSNWYYKNSFCRTTGNMVDQDLWLFTYYKFWLRGDINIQ